MAKGCNVSDLYYCIFFFCKHPTLPQRLYYIARLRISQPRLPQNNLLSKATLRIARRQALTGATGRPATTLPGTPPAWHWLSPWRSRSLALSPDRQG